jgi:hypothetical protein
MTRMILVLGVVAFLMALTGSALAVDLVKVMPMPEKARLATGDEPVGNAQYYPSRPGTICSPGDTMGFTQYDYQSNGSSGRRIVVDNQGGLHFDWMCGEPYPSTRNVKFNCLTASGSPWPGTGQTASRHNGAGYCQIGITTDDRAALAYHFAPSANESTFVAIDVFNCLGTFSYWRPLLRQGANHMIWPYVAVDRNNRIHITATTATANAGDPQPFGYARSNNGGSTWVYQVPVDTTMTIAGVVASSKVSDKVAIIYTHPMDLTTQWMNDIVYIESQNGTSWDWRNGKVNVTNYGQNGDSLFAYTDLAALYDYNDNLHIIWNAQYVTDAGIYYSAQLLHYATNSGTISQIAQFDSTWPSAGCAFGVWNWGFGKMSLAVDRGNDIYASYTSWDTSDCSLGGYGNGDI